MLSACFPCQTSNTLKERTVSSLVITVSLVSSKYQIHSKYSGNSEWMNEWMNKLDSTSIWFDTIIWISLCHYHNGIKDWWQTSFFTSYFYQGHLSVSHDKFLEISHSESVNWNAFSKGARNTLPEGSYTLSRLSVSELKHSTDTWSWWYMDRDYFSLMMMNRLWCHFKLQNQ